MLYRPSEEGGEGKGAVLAVKRIMLEIEKCVAPWRRGGPKAGDRRDSRG